MRKITIIEVCSNLSLGGTERAMQEFAIGLDKSKFNVIVCVLDDSGPRKDILKNHKIQIVKINKREDLAGVVKKYGADIVHAHSLRIGKFAGSAKYIKEVVFSSSYEPDADMNLIISKTLALKISTVENLDYTRKAQVLYYPQNVQAWDKLKISNDERKKVRKLAGFSPNDLVIGRLGRAEPSKTDFLLLESAAKIAKKVPNAKFLFVGLPLLFRKKLSMHPILKNRLVFVPETSDDTQIAKFYQMIDVFWHTASRGETFGNVNTEAMIFEKPVITHSTPFKGKDLKETLDNAQIEIVDHMKTGLVASHPKDVVAAVELLEKNRPLLKHMGRNGRQKVVDKYNSKVIISQFEKIAEGILSKKQVTAKPSKQEIDNYFRKEYQDRLNNQISKTSAFGKKSYILKKKAYSALEFGYLGARYVLREKMKYNIEKTGYNNKKNILSK